MDVNAFDIGYILWQGVKFSLCFAPVIICSPIAHQFLQVSKLDPLGAVSDGLFIRQTGFIDAVAQIVQLSLWYMYFKRLDLL